MISANVSLHTSRISPCNGRVFAKGSAYGCAFAAIGFFVLALLQLTGKVTLSGTMADLSYSLTPTFALLSIVLFYVTRTKTIRVRVDNPLRTLDRPIPVEIRARADNPLQGINNPLSVTRENWKNFPEIYRALWMTMFVSRYKPMGEWESRHDQGWTSYQQSCFDNGDFSYRAPDIDKGDRERDRAQMRQYVLAHRGNCQVGGQQTQYYNSQAIYDLLYINRDLLLTFARHAGLSPGGIEEAEALHRALQQGQVEESVRLFVDSHHGIIPSSLFMILLGSYTTESYMKKRGAEYPEDHLRAEREFAEAMRLPEKGVEEIVELRKRFPSQHWITIQSLLVYFHRKGFEDCSERTSEVLERLSRNGRDVVYFVHGDQLCADECNHFYRSFDRRDP